MFDLLPLEILIFIFNYLIPFDIILPYSDNPIILKRENNKENIKLIRASNQLLCNVALCNKNLKKIIYEKCLKSIYFKDNINMKLLFIFKPIIIYAPFDETLTEEDLRIIFKKNIHLKKIYVERNSLIKDFKVNCPSLENYKNTWVALFYDKFYMNNSHTNELTKNIKNYNELIKKNFIHFQDHEALKIFWKLFRTLSEYSGFYYSLKEGINENFYRLDLYLDNYDDLKNTCQQSYLVIHINSFKLLKSIEKKNVTYFNIYICMRHINYKEGRLCSYHDRLDLGLIYYHEFQFHKY